jgi:hypothetical protein
MANNKTYKKPRGAAPKAQSLDDVRRPTGLSSQKPSSVPRINRAVVELQMMPQSANVVIVPSTGSSVLPEERVGPPRGAKRLDALVTPRHQSPVPHPRSPLLPRTSSPMPRPRSPHTSSPMPHPQSPHTSSPVPHHQLPTLSHPPSHVPQTQSPGPPTPPTVIAPANFPMDVEEEDPLQHEDSEDSVRDSPSRLPLFLSDDESDMGDPKFDLDADVEDDPAADDEDEGNTLNDNDDDEEEEEEIVSSMMTGGRFTREQVLEVKDLAKTLVTTLQRCAKDWKRPLDTVMRIANLVIATKERRAGGNAWNAYQNAFPEDPDKATRK